MNIITGERISEAGHAALSAENRLSYVKVAGSAKEAREKLLSLDAPRKAWMKNKSCPCGSGKKFKKCHWIMKKDTA